MITIARLGLSAWLVTLAVADLRKGEVTNWATVPPLLAVTTWQVLTGGWPLALMLTLILAGAQWPVFAVPSLGLMALCAWFATPLGLDVAVWVWICVYILWQIGRVPGRSRAAVSGCRPKLPTCPERAGVIGGADAKVVMTLMALFPDGWLAWLLLLCWFGLSVVYLLHRHGKHAPQALLRATKGLVRFQVLEEEGERYPALPAVALAGLIYVWFYLGSL
ncbi:MAG: prepilin peptidase [Anaerolineae bacterium]|nr:prepilin peptidase [Anaerolineae bacterium]